MNQPLPTNWDEAHYLTIAYRDASAFQTGGCKRLLANFVYDDPGRPPAYRLFAAPLDLVVGVNLVALRLESLASLLLTLALIFAAVYRATRSPRAAAISALLPLLSPLILEQSMHLATEASLYVATAATLWGVLHDWDNPNPRATGWIMLGIALGLGALTKLTFGLIGGSLLLLTALACGRRMIRGPGVAYLLKASLLGAVVALPWWLHNSGFAFAFASYSMEFRRHSLGALNLPVAAHYLLNVLRFACGLLPAVIALAAIGAGLFLTAKRSRGEDSAVDSQVALLRPAAARMAILALFITAAGLITAQLLTSNHEPRLVTPATFLLAAAAGLAIGQYRSSAGSFSLEWGAALLLASQLLILASPAFLEPLRRLPVIGTSDLWPFRPAEEWDYEPLYSLCAQAGFDDPTLATLGNSFTFNIAQARLAWARHGRDIRCSQLWRWEKGNCAIEQLLLQAKNYDIVLTAPRLIGALSEHQDWDNQFNMPFAARLERDADFGAPVELWMGRMHPVQMLVFFNHAKMSRNRGMISRGARDEVHSASDSAASLD